MKLVVGLGNPGQRYRHTRHNVGYDVVGRLAAAYAEGRPKRKFEGEVLDARIGDQRVMLLCPTTYMNRSGLSVRLARDFFELTDEGILVICDDINLPLARLRFRARGSAGGQKGLADIIRCLQTEEVARLRIGIGPVPDAWDVSDFVLSKFRNDERDSLEDSLVRARDGVVDWVRSGTEYCMNQYNAQ